MDLRWGEVMKGWVMKGLRDKIDELNVLCHSLIALRALRHLGEHCVFVFLI
ncbi:MAG: hypothetical protein RLZZ205_156 [Bacteroidota bacterium]